MQVQVLSGVPNAPKAGIGLRARLMSVLLAGSSPARCTRAFGRAVMHLAFNQTQTGSIPVAPTRPSAPVMQLGRHRLLKISVLLVRVQSGV